MGEAPAFFADDLLGSYSNGFGLKSKGHQTAVDVGHKKYVIGDSDGKSASLGVKVFEKSTGEWIIPAVLGTIPQPSKGHSALVWNEDRILVLKGGSAQDDCFWFLEVDTPLVREQRKILGTEVVAWSKGVVGDVRMPIVISGPSGVGKGTLIAKLMKEFPSTFGFSVSHTTRAPREKEQNGVHYHFSERNSMEKEIKDGKFLEFASVHGNLYGTSMEAVEVVADAGKRCILDIDVQGARSVRASSLEAIFIFICPPSFEELEKRLRARGTETEEQMLKRLRNARTELEQGKAPGLFDHILVNDDLETCYNSLKKLLGLDEGVPSNHESGLPSFKKLLPDFVSEFSLTHLKLDLPLAASLSVDLPRDHSVSKLGQKIVITCGTKEDASKSMFLLDLSSLKGGAPGRTRGLQIYSIDSRRNGLNGQLA